MTKQSINEVLEHIGNASRALEDIDIADALNISIEDVQYACKELLAEAQIIQTRRGGYALPKLLELCPCRVTAQRNGTLLAVPLDGSPAMKLGLSRSRLHPLPEDRVLVRHGRPGMCELYAITRRGLTRLPAYLRLENDTAPKRTGRKPKGRYNRPEKRPNRPAITAVACDRRISCSIAITGELLGARNDDIVMLCIDRYPDDTHPLTAHIERVFGGRSDIHARLAAIALMHGFDTNYPIEPDDSSETLSPNASREDLRSLITFTIDGPFSKDFDDAVSLESLPDGTCMLGVHIADVTHYVRPGTALDAEALKRGTSLYLPGLTVPMLPEQLSNDLCSLMPDTDRYCLTAFIHLSDGRVIDSRICRSIIHSHARLTYDQVNRFLDGAEHEVEPVVGERLRHMAETARDIRRRRTLKGCIDLDLPETDFVLDEENRPTDVFAEPRGEAERMIEDFMLSANEAVAAFARYTETPIIYRVHEAPDPERLHTLEELLSTIDIREHFGPKPTVKALQHVLTQTADHPAADTVRRTLLRCMQRARYSEQPLGHYALALEDYCHFTSPIRRYPDLMVHRMIKQLLDGQIDETRARMAMLSDQCSSREQEAASAEREAVDLMKALYMQGQLGTRADGIITAIKSWGMYVMLENTVEGLVHINSLDDYYIYNEDKQTLTGEATGVCFKLGDRVRIQVKEVDIERAEIGFELLPPDYMEEKHNGQKR